MVLAIISPKIALDVPRVESYVSTALLMRYEPIPYVVAFLLGAGTYPLMLKAPSNGGY